MSLNKLKRKYFCQSQMCIQNTWDGKLTDDCSAWDAEMFLQRKLAYNFWNSELYRRWRSPWKHTFSTWTSMCIFNSEISSEDFRGSVRCCVTEPLWSGGVTEVSMVFSVCVCVFSYVCQPNRSTSSYTDKHSCRGLLYLSTVFKISFDSTQPKL